MTQTFAVNANNDLFIGSDGNLSISTGKQAIALACSSAAKAQLGEMIYAVNSGMPNFQTIWNGAPNLQQFEAALRNTLLSVMGVSEILNLYITIIDSTVSYSATISTEFGAETFNGNIPI